MADGRSADSRSRSARPFAIIDNRMSTAIDPSEPQVLAGEADTSRALAPEETVFRMRQQVLDGTHWFEAVLDAIGRWRLPEERVGNRTYRYLTGGDAFDWLLLAERLIDEMPDLVPG